MKIYAYEVRSDEELCFKRIGAELKAEIIVSDKVPTVETAADAAGCDGVTTLGQGAINKDILDIWHGLGIKYLATRTIGYNHIDVEYARSLGMKVCNASYGPESVADFTVMLMLMCMRNYKQALWRGQVNDFSLNGLQGRCMKDMTVGIMGTGRIGHTVIKNLSGFGCRILAYDKYQNEKVKELAQYVDIETIFRECDIISLHLPLLDSTYHIVRGETIAKMKDGVIIINCARGELAETDAMIKGIEQGKIGALGLDVLEGEEGITHMDHRITILSNREMAYLRQFRNVVMTPHMAFYTDAAVESMVECAIRGLTAMKTDGTCPTEIKPR